MKGNIDLTEGRVFSREQPRDTDSRYFFGGSRFKTFLKIFPWQNRCFQFLPKKIRVPGNTVFIKDIIYSEGICHCCGRTRVPWIGVGLCRHCEEEVANPGSSAKIPWRNTEPIPSAKYILEI